MTGVGARHAALGNGTRRRAPFRATPASTAPSAPTAPSARDALKRATDPVHERLDRGLSRFDLGCPIQYGRFLAVHAAALPALEAALRRAGFARLCAGWTDAERSGALLADLDGLGRPVPAPLDASVSCGAGAWGVAYVLEGSRLGGRVLARRAAAAGCPSVVNNARFLNAPPGLPWPRFLGQLEAALAAPSDRSAAIAGARAAFELFERALLDETPDRSEGTTGRGSSPRRPAAGARHELEDG